MQRLTRFYCLVNPVNSDVFYVGRTTRSVKKRLQDHIRDGIKLKTKKSRYIAEILVQNLTPIILEIEALNNLSKKDAVEREKHWIHYFLNRGVELTNTASAEMGRHGGEHASLIMDDVKKAMLGTLPDEVLADLWGCERRTVCYYRNKFGIDKCGNREKQKPPHMGGWNKKHFPQSIHNRLGLQSDSSLARELGVSKPVIARLRRNKGIPSYADSNGHPTKFKQGDPHPRWSRVNSNS